MSKHPGARGRTDRAASVRAVATGLLAKLAGSAFSLRAEVRAASLLVYTPPVPPSLWKKLRGTAPSASLDARPPAEIPKEWERDGLGGAPPQGVGERAWRLTQALALVPPSAWCVRFTSTPAELIAATAASEWRRALLFAWQRAAITFRESDWAVALAAVWSAEEVRSERSERWPPIYLIDLVTVMTRSDAEPFLVGRLQSQNTRASAILTIAARVTPPAIGDSFMRPLIAALRKEIDEDVKELAIVIEALLAAAAAWPPSGIPDAIALAESIAAKGSVSKRHDAFVSTLRLRQRIHQEIVP